MDIDKETKLKLAERLQEVVELLKKDDTYILALTIVDSRDIPAFTFLGPDLNYERGFNVDLATWKHEYSLKITIDKERQCQGI